MGIKDMTKRYQSISINNSQASSETAVQMAKSQDKASLTSDQSIISNYREGKQHLAVVEKKGEVMDTCATIHDDYVCCNVKVLKSVSNCPFDCSYCFLQNYLNDGTTKVVGDIQSMMAEVHSKISAEPWRLFRIGTWELGDSLALEDITKQGAQLICEFAKLPNALLELKTKSDCVDPILHCDHQQKTVVSWSMNSSHIIDTEEHKTASLDQRLAAMKKVGNAGYLIGIHLDPMIYYESWKEDYTHLIESIFSVVVPEQIAWISLGSLRFNPEMASKMMANFPASSLPYEAMKTGPDGKMRYVKPLRLEMYRHVISELCRVMNIPSIESLSPLATPSIQTPLFYFCMERWDIWDKVLGSHPSSIQHLDYLFARSLHGRYPDIIQTPGSLEQYLTAN